MNITYVIADYTRSSGIERVLANKANYLVNNGFNVSIITYAHNGAEPFFCFDEKINFYNIDLGKMKYEKGLLRKIENLRKKKQFLHKLTALLDEIQSDITISVAMGFGFYVHKAKDKSKKILESHFSKYRRKLMMVKFDKYLLGRIITYIYSYQAYQHAKGFDRFVLLTNEDKESWRGLENVAVIPNALTFIPDEISVVTQKRVIAVGRITNQKGFDKLVDIWSEIRLKYPDWRLDIFGTESERKIERLQAQINKLGLSSCITINKPTKAIKSEFLNSSIYVMTSRYEGAPMVLVEAMAIGLPAVAYACKCGPRDIINDKEDGFLVEVDDKRDFIHKLSMLMEDRVLRAKMGATAAQNILRLSESKIMLQWVKLFQEI